MKILMEKSISLKHSGHLPGMFSHWCKSAFLEWLGVMIVYNFIIFKRFRSFEMYEYIVFIIRNKSQHVCIHMFITWKSKSKVEMVGLISTNLKLLSKILMKKLCILWNLVNLLNYMAYNNASTSDTLGVWVSDK